MLMTQHPCHFSSSRLLLHEPHHFPSGRCGHHFFRRTSFSLVLPAGLRQAAPTAARSPTPGGVLRVRHVHAAELFARGSSWPPRSCRRHNSLDRNSWRPPLRNLMICSVANAASSRSNLLSSAGLISNGRATRFGQRRFPSRWWIRGRNSSVSALVWRVSAILVVAYIVIEHTTGKEPNANGEV